MFRYRYFVSRPSLVRLVAMHSRQNLSFVNKLPEIGGNRFNTALHQNSHAPTCTVGKDNAAWCSKRFGFLDEPRRLDLDILCRLFGYRDRDLSLLGRVLRSGCRSFVLVLLTPTRSVATRTRESNKHANYDSA